MSAILAVIMGWHLGAFAYHPVCDQSTCPNECWSRAKSHLCVAGVCLVALIATRS